MLLFIISCEQDPTILTEYEGVNLIANKGFDSPDWNPDQGATYMTFEEVTGVSLPAGVTGAAVYRLEIKNLVDDGEFEVGAIGTTPAGWSATGSATFEVSNVAVQSGNSLLFNNPARADTVEFDLLTLTDSYLMLPTKSVSGVYFETEKSFNSCQLCTREMCPSRRAAYTGRI